MSKYVKLTYKLVWFEYFNRESIDISSSFGVLSIFQLFLTFTFDFLYIFLSILDNLKVSYIFLMFLIYFKSKIINIFRHINLFQIHSGIRIISVQVEFGFGSLDTKILNPFGFGSIFSERVRLSLPENCYIQTKILVTIEDIP